jgi:hypothetical protein
MFTGSAPYREIFMATLHPGFLGNLAWNLLGALRPSRGRPAIEPAEGGAR